MNKFILLCAFLFLNHQAVSVDDSVETRIQELEIELQKLKEKKQTVNSVQASKKPTIKKAGKLSQLNVQEDVNDLDDLLPLEEITPAPKIEIGPLKKIQDKDATAKKEIASVKLSEPSNDRAIELYAQSKVMLGQRKLEHARQILQEIITAYPESPYFIIAQYWLGELNLHKQDYMGASLAYGTIFEKYKTGQVSNEFRNRVAESLIKFSYCLKMLKKKQEACIILKEFEKEFKDVPHNIRKFALETRAATECVKK